MPGPVGPERAGNQPVKVEAVGIIPGQTQPDISLEASGAAVQARPDVVSKELRGAIRRIAIATGKDYLVPDMEETPSKVDTIEPPSIAVGIGAKYYPNSTPF